MTITQSGIIGMVGKPQYAALARRVGAATAILEDILVQAFVVRSMATSVSSRSKSNISGVATRRNLFATIATKSKMPSSSN